MTEGARASRIGGPTGRSRTGNPQPGLILEDGRHSDVHCAAGSASDGRSCRGDCGADAAADSSALTAPLDFHAPSRPWPRRLCGHESRQNNLNGSGTMSLLIDLVSGTSCWRWDGAIDGPWSRGGIHVRFCRAGVCVHLAADDFSRATQTAGLGLGVYACAVVVGAGGTLVSILHLQRNPSDRALALLCLAVNGTAIAVPAIGIFIR